MSAPLNPMAYPCLDSNGYGLSMRDPGMSLRDAVAIAALPAIITATSNGQHRPGANLEGATIAEAIVHDALEMADAFLAARIQSPTEGTEE